MCQSLLLTIVLNAFVRLVLYIISEPSVTFKDSWTDALSSLIEGNEKENSCKSVAR